VKYKDGEYISERKTISKNILQKKTSLQMSEVKREDMAYRITLFGI
jgi:hypothetical protein